MATTRRKFLVGAGGAVMALPFLEGLAPKGAKAANNVPPFAIFHRKGNGVQQALFDKNPAAEPERWWPNLPYGALTQASLAGQSDRALSELSAYATKLTILRGLKHPVGTQNGHREGSIQGITGAGVKYPNNVPDIFNCDPLGESLDNRLARDLTPNTPLSLYLGVGAHDAGGVSFLNNKDAQGKQVTRAAEENMVALYNRMFLPQQGGGAAQALLANKRKSINDLVRTELTELRSDARLSAADKDRLDLHTSSIRDVETQFLCTIPGALANDAAVYNAHVNSDPAWWKGNSILQAHDIFAKMVAVAVSCGMTRSVLISIGTPTDTVNYFHEISHRQSQDGNPATNIAGAQLLHHKLDRFHLQQFKKILDALAQYTYNDGTTLLDQGTCVHYSDMGTGQHDLFQLPYVYVGGAGGALRVGRYENVSNEPVAKLLNTIGAAVGVKNAAGAPLDDFNAANNGNIVGRLTSLVV
jgi:hypothetical protein